MNQPQDNKGSDEYTNLIGFLHGKQMWKGRWFGDKPSGTYGAYWWRKEMDAIIQAHITSQVEQAVREALISENRYHWHRQKQIENGIVSKYFLDRIAELRGDNG